MRLDFFPFKPLAGSSVAGNEPHIATTLGAGVHTMYVPPGANCVLIQATAQNIRFTLTGTTPTASVGFQLTAGDSPVLIGLEQNTTLQFFREASGAILQYSFGKNKAVRE